MAEVSLPKSRPKNAAAIVKRDLKESKLKVPEISEETKKHRDQMALLEIRAEADPYLIDNPAARLGFDIIERGVEVDGKSGGELLAMIASGQRGLSRFNVRPGFAGLMMPSDEYNLDPGAKEAGITGSFQTDNFKKKYPGKTEVLRRQGIEQLLPSSEGSTIYYLTGQGSDENRPAKGEDMTTLMEELAHLGMRYVKQQGDMATGVYGRRFSLPDEERAMDVMQARSAINQGAYATPKNIERLKRDPYSSAAQNVELIDAASEKALGSRGVPPIAKRIEPGIMESILGMFK